MMKIQMRKIAVIGVMIAAFAHGMSAASFAALTHGVAYTKHNLSSSGLGQFRALTETQICIFCHTPHNAAAGKSFLWNRTNTINTFLPYTATPYIDDASKASMANLSEVSKMCMSCHDGATALNSMANPRAGIDPVDMLDNYDQISDAVFDMFGTGQWGTNIGQYDMGSGGGVLVNDHPVSFDYEQVRTHNVALGNNTLRTQAVAEGNGVLFWNGKVECVTCHEPHVNYNTAQGGDAAYSKFLRRPNASSGLCFACHDK